MEYSEVYNLIKHDWNLVLKCTKKYYGFASVIDDLDILHYLSDKCKLNIHKVQNREIIKNQLSFDKFFYMNSPIDDKKLILYAIDINIYSYKYCPLKNDYDVIMSVLSQYKDHLDYCMQVFKNLDYNVKHSINFIKRLITEIPFYKSFIPDEYLLSV